MSQAEPVEIEVLRVRKRPSATTATCRTIVTSNELQRHEQHTTVTSSSNNSDIDLTRQLTTARSNDSDLARFAHCDFSGIDRITPNNTFSQATTIRDNSISHSSEQAGLSGTTQAAVSTSAPISEERTVSAEYSPGSDMGYVNTIQSQSRSHQDASIKMERTPSLHSSTTSSGPKDSDADEILSIDSIGRGAAPVMSPQSPRSPVGSRHMDGIEALSSSAFGTPSTISTAPSTEADEGSWDGTDSLLGLDRATWRLDDVVTPMLLPRSPAIQSIPATDSAQHGIATMPSPEAAVSGEQFYHRRSRSWEQEHIRRQEQVRSWEGSPVAPYPSPHSHGSHAGTWEQVGAPQSRVATFRTSPGTSPPGYASVAAHPDAWHQVPRSGEPRHSHGHHMHLEPRPGPPYHQAPYGGIHGQPNAGYGPHPAGTQTPPRSKQPRSPLHTPQRSPSAPSTPVGSASSSPSGPNPPRSSSEILKTLLRKKACLYEPDTSRAIAFVTWLVGRELALEYGYFSRQQLQSGVHACVAKKIEIGTITRTKVNRCMQIILNSCFHYIIPRPDGSEENGEAFRDTFTAEAVDDSIELQVLPAPWADLAVDKEFVLTAASRESSPTNSPRLGSQQSSKASDDGHSKRAVLLCFNENVRSFEDVLRCHNEFIRDTANAANLQLSDKEWRVFFGREAAKTTMAWGSASVSTAIIRPEGDVSKIPDILGRMDTDELSRFRTTWCAKRYEHDHVQCAFAHVEVNGGWLRRSPAKHSYRAELCPSVVGVADKMISPFSFMLNQCEKGEKCDFAHSNEEIAYHPDRYKRKMCLFTSSKGGTCPLGDICPNFHTAQNMPRGKRRASPDRRGHGLHRASVYKGSHGLHAGKAATTVIPEGSPMLYVSPAPFSSYENHLGPPGLQSLFRRHSSVIAGCVRHGDRCRCCYSNFGDNTGIGLVGHLHHTSPHRGLPSIPAQGP